MGGRGSSSSFTTVTPTPAPAPIPAPALQPDPQDDDTQAVAATATPSGVTLAEVQQMSDQELHDFLINVYKTDIPDFLNKVHLQKMIYALNLNAPPEIVDQKTFDSLVKQGNTPIYRTVNSTTVNGIRFTAGDICDMMTDGDTTFVGNGIHGDGLYFSNSLSGSKSYGYSSTSQTVGAVFNSNAKIISESALRQQYNTFIQTHPQTRKALGFARSKSSNDSMSQFALIQGYNVISSPQGGGETYYTVIDRSALTMTKKRY